MSDTTNAPTARSSTSSAAPRQQPTSASRLVALQDCGQSLWLDYLRCSLFTSGEFQRLIAEDGLRGVTANPSIFEKAIVGSTDNLTALHAIERRRDLDPMALYETLAVEDIRQAADLLRPIYNATNGADGYVSFEVSPYLAHDTAATVAEAHRLWDALDRRNVMIKVATVEGVPAHVLSAALYEQFSSRGEADFVDQLLSPMRYEFGGHVEQAPAAAGSRTPRDAS